MDWKIIALICAIQTGLYVYFRQKNKNRNFKSCDTYNNIEVFNFTRFSSICNVCSNNRQCNNISCSYYAQRRIISLLENAQSSIDLCMYMVSSKNLADAVMKAFNQGVKVRVITDAGSSFSSASQIRYFRKQAIPVRIKRTETLMHHKFVIVDKKMLITGSTNWTAQSFLGNWDHLLIISEPVLVNRFASEFDELFKNFSQAHRQ